MGFKVWNVELEEYSVKKYNDGENVDFKIEKNWQDYHTMLLLDYNGYKLITNVVNYEIENIFDFDICIGFLLIDIKTKKIVNKHLFSECQMLETNDNIIVYNEDQIKIFEAWLYDNVIHRQNEPAIIVATSSNGFLGSYYEHGVRPVNGLYGSIYNKDRKISDTFVNNNETSKIVFYNKDGTMTEMNELRNRWR